MELEDGGNRIELTPITTMIVVIGGLYEARSEDAMNNENMLPVVRTTISVH